MGSAARRFSWLASHAYSALSIQNAVDMRGRATGPKSPGAASSARRGVRSVAVATVLVLVLAFGGVSLTTARAASTALGVNLSAKRSLAKTSARNLVAIRAESKTGATCGLTGPYTGGLSKKTIPGSGRISWTVTLPVTAFGKYSYTVKCVLSGTHGRASIEVRIAYVPESKYGLGGVEVHPAGALASGQTLSRGQSINSPRDQYQVRMQTDGNLVLYTQGTALWNSGTAGHPGAYARMQTDGNLVVYSSGGQPLWSSQTSGHPYASANLQDDGNFVVYDISSKPLWASGTVNDRLLAGQELLGSKSQSLFSPHEQYQLIMQTDGNLVLYGQGVPLWNSGTEGNPGAYAIMQTDGNLVVYSSTNQVLWDSKTNGNPGAYLRVQDDGNLVVYSNTNQALFNTGTIQNTLTSGQKLLGGQSVYSPNEQYQLKMQTDGNLVLYQGMASLWSSATQSNPGAYAIMQTDGNFVVYSSTNQALWDSDTAGHPGADLVLQNDGNLVVYLAGQALWDTNTQATPPSYVGSDATALAVAAKAETYNGQTQIPSAWAAICHCGPHWSGFCEAFVGLVTGHGYSTAYQDYLDRKAHGLIHTTGVPPRGAIVYWDPGLSAYGHVGISLGGGMEISTYGYGGNDYPIQEHSYLYFSNYLGWAMPY